MSAIINSFPGYEYKDGKNLYRGVDVGFGGYVYAEPGMYGNVALLDVASMHPSSIIAMNCFGDYTQHFKDILDARIAIKRNNFDAAKQMMDGKLAKYLDDENVAADLSQALKISINSVYGLTSANFDNPFRDIRNKNNIVALRGALFMKTLQDEVQERGFTVAHIKTDSIKIPNATPEIIDFVTKFGKRYGYEFEHEATYDRMCLVNNAVYIAKYASSEKCKELYGYVPGDNAKKEKKGIKWTATGTQFAVPYVFKRLFSGEPIEFEDLCETKSVKSALYLDMNENLPDVSEWDYLKELREKNPDNMTKKEQRFCEDNIDISDEELEKRIAEGHSYRFVGKVGNFCPIKPGCGGGELYREQNGKYYAATGTSGHRWLEAEVVAALNKEEDIDYSYHEKLVNDAVDTIAQYGDFEWFVSDDPYVPPIIDYPPWEDESDDPQHFRLPFE